MSRLYETLKRIEEGRPESILAAIDAGAPAPAPPVLVIQEREQAVAATGPAERPALAAGPRTAVLDCGRTVRLRVPAGAPLFPFDGSDTRAAEQYRMLRTKLLQHELQPRVIAVSSGDAGDGKTVTAINTAGALSLKNGVKVLLIDADMRRCSVAPLLGIEQSPGLAEVLRGECAFQDAVVQLEDAPNLYVLPGGSLAVNPAELLDSVEWRALLQAARDKFRFTIIDTTPVAAVTDFDLVQTVSDGVLIVARPDHTKRNVLDHALSAVRKPKMLGVVINRSKDWFLWKRYDAPYGSYGAARNSVATPAASARPSSPRRGGL